MRDSSDLKTIDIKQIDVNRLQYTNVYVAIKHLGLLIKTLSHQYVEFLGYLATLPVLLF